MAITKATASSVAPAAKGDLVVGSATNDAAILAVGTNDYVLTADSAATNGVKWAAPAGGGKVLQVVEGTYSTQTDNSTSTYADTNLTASITPSAASSKILVFTSQLCIKNELNADSAVYLQLLRGATQISELIGLGYTNNTTRQYTMACFLKLDSPNTTSSVTYKTQFKNGTNANGVSIQAAGSTSVIVLMEIGA